MYISLLHLKVVGILDAGTHRMIYPLSLIHYHAGQILKNGLTVNFSFLYYIGWHYAIYRPRLLFSQYTKTGQYSHFVWSFFKCGLANRISPFVRQLLSGEINFCRFGLPSRKIYIR